ncbi:retropepsin-like aspartic protease family protein [Cochlodiniinecator piscidefendens]|uniref:retropepsin-like aspartic protease family protein n=1 Tax=Cochlodiniinecator piscidefendens TaxID=2715756 RepID=UPI00140A96EE|nr:TIGR02281 family clan AA aspartic protease [Cochlodiniinecator piscidefendens]
MGGDDFGQLVYLGLLGAAVVAWFISQNRNSMGKTLQQAMVWGLLFVGVIAAYGLWGDIRRAAIPQQHYQSDSVVEIPRSRDGHYNLVLVINNQAVEFTVDTGATHMVLSAQDAEAIGIDPNSLSYFGQAQTANGIVGTARVNLETVELGPIIDRNVSAQVNGGEMSGSLLGMSYLNRFNRIEINNGVLTLER